MSIAEPSIPHCDVDPLADLLSSALCCAGHRANPISDGLTSAECGDDG